MIHFPHSILDERIKQVKWTIGMRNRRITPQSG
jgi:hypothetical protein